MTRIGFGCMGLSQGYGPADEQQSIDTIDAALDAGVDMFDTAMSYGQGRNETLVGKALGSRGSVATKFGIVRGPDGVVLDGHPGHVRRYCEESLRRLGRDVIDLYYLHRVDPAVPLEETIGAMSELVAAGLVKELGVSEVTPEQLTTAHTVHPMSAVQFEWSLMWREPERMLIPAARRLGISLVAYSPLGRGLLTHSLSHTEVAGSAFRANDPRFRGVHLDGNLANVERLAGLAGKKGVTPGQLALAWLLAQGDDVIAIPGTRLPARARENAAAADVQLSDAEAGAIGELGTWLGDRTSFAVPVTARE